jgi:RNA polymerase sigma-70 factor (ECF subfamily)
MPEPDLASALEEHHAASFGWAVYCCDGNPTEAEEVLQVAYLEVLDGKAIFSGRSRFRTWLFGVIRNVAASRRRRRRLRAALLLRRHDEAPRPTPEVAADHRLLGHEQEVRLRDALAQLPRRQREVLVLTFYEDLTIQAASEVLKISLGSARTHYHRGKQRLRTLLALDAEATP